MGRVLHWSSGGGSYLPGTDAGFTKKDYGIRMQGCRVCWQRALCLF